MLDKSQRMELYSSATFLIHAGIAGPRPTPCLRSSKRAKDEADLLRICESNPQVLSLIPSGTFACIDELRRR